MKVRDLLRITEIVPVILYSSMAAKGLRFEQSIGKPTVLRPNSQLSVTREIHVKLSIN